MRKQKHTEMFWFPMRISLAVLMLIAILGIPFSSRVMAGGPPICGRFAKDGEHNLVLLDTDELLDLYSGNQYTVTGKPVVVLWQATAVDWDSLQRRELPTDGRIYKIGNMSSSIYGGSDPIIKIEPFTTKFGAVALAIVGDHPIVYDPSYCLPPTPIPTVELVITSIKIDPDPPVEFKREKIRLTIVNQGNKRLEQPFWDYSGQIVLKKETAGKVENIQEIAFSKDHSSSINPVDLNLPERWYFTISDVHFWKWGKDAELEVFVRPADRSIRPFIASKKPFSIDPNPTALGRCGAFVTRSFAAVLPSGNARIFLNSVAAGESLFTCKDIPCMAKAVVTLLLKVVNNVIALIQAVWEIFNPNTEGIEDCVDLGAWVDEIVKELTRQGSPTNLHSVRSPALILVTNQAGQRAGFLDDGKIVEEIPGSKVANARGGKFVLYPADNNTVTQLKGTGDGTMTVDLIISDGGNGGLQIIYKDVPVTARTVAKVGSSDAQHLLKIDSNSDGTIDQSRAPDKVEKITEVGKAAPQPIETPTPVATPVVVVTPTVSKQPGGVCGGAFGLVILPVFALVWDWRRKKASR